MGVLLGFLVGLGFWVGLGFLVDVGVGVGVDVAFLINGPGPGVSVNVSVGEIGVVEPIGVDLMGDTGSSVAVPVGDEVGDGLDVGGPTRPPTVVEVDVGVKSDAPWPVTITSLAAALPNIEVLIARSTSGLVSCGTTPAKTCKTVDCSVKVCCN